MTLLLLLGGAAELEDATPVGGGTDTLFGTVYIEWSPTTRPLEAPVWVDMTPYLRDNTGFRIKRGRQSELDRFQPGTLDFVLDNRGLLFDPQNSSGTYFGNLEPMRRVRALVTVGGTTHSLFEGFIIGWPQEYDLSNREAVVPIHAIDAFEILANTNAEDNFFILDDDIFGRLDFNRLGADGVEVVEETSGERVATVLNIVGWPSGERDIDTGLSLLSADAISGSALSYLQKVEDSEDGFFFVAKDGDIVFLARSARWTNTHLTTTQFTLADDGSDMPYNQVSLRYDRDFVLNDITRQRDGGEEQRASDSTSMLDYGRRRDEKTGLLVSSDAQAKSLADYRLVRFKSPQVRPEPVRVPLRAKPSEMADAARAELLDRVVLERRPMGGTVRTFTGLIQSIEHTISMASWEAVFTISPGDIDDTQYFVLNDPDNGVLDENILAY